MGRLDPNAAARLGNSLSPTQQATLLDAVMAADGVPDDDPSRPRHRMTKGNQCRAAAKLEAIGLMRGTAPTGEGYSVARALQRAAA